MCELPNDILNEIFSYLLSEVKYYSIIRSLNKQFKNFADEIESNGRVIEINRNKFIKYINEQPSLINLDYITYNYQELPIICSYRYKKNHHYIDYNKSYYQCYCEPLANCDCNKHKNLYISLSEIINKISDMYKVFIPLDIVIYFLYKHPLISNKNFKTKSLYKNFDFHSDKFEYDLNKFLAIRNVRITGKCRSAILNQYDNLFQYLIFQFDN